MAATPALASPVTRQVRSIAVASGLRGYRGRHLDRRIAAGEGDLQGLHRRLS